MFSPGNQRFTRFDMMEHSGVFRRNPANQFAEVVNGESLYKGPVEFPRMVYWPEEEIIVQGWDEDTPRGPKFVGEQRALKFSLVENKSELDAALAAGAMDHPSKALAAIKEANLAAGLKDTRFIPAISTAHQVDALSKEIEDLRAKLAAAQKGVEESKGASTPPSGPKGLSRATPLPPSAA